MNEPSKGNKKGTYKSILELLAESQEADALMEPLEKKVAELQATAAKLVPPSLVKLTEEDLKLKPKQRVLESLTADPLKLVGKPLAGQKLVLRMARKQVAKLGRLVDAGERSGLDALGQSPLFPLLEKLAGLEDTSKKIQLSLVLNEVDSTPEVINWGLNITDFVKHLLNPDPDLQEVKRLSTLIKTQSANLRGLAPDFLTMALTFGRMEKQLDAIIQERAIESSPSALTM